MRRTICKRSAQPAIGGIQSRDSNLGTDVRLYPFDSIGILSSLSSLSLSLSNNLYTNTYTINKRIEKEEYR